MGFYKGLGWTRQLRVWGLGLSSLTLGLAVVQAGTLTVIKGSGSGTYTTGANVMIWANPYNTTDPTITNVEQVAPTPASPIQIFDHWLITGVSTSALGNSFDPNAVQTSLIAPSANITLTAIYKDAPRWLAPRVVSFFPIGYHSVIFMFHGSGGCAGCLYASAEDRQFIEDATSRGFGVVALSSYDRLTAQWDSTLPASQNIDMQRVVAARNNLIARGDMVATDPIYLRGTSNGGDFTTLLAQQTEVPLSAGGLQSLFPKPLAQALYISPGNGTALAATTVATIFLLAQQDASIKDSTAITQFGILASHSIPTQIWINPPSPVYAERFWRIEGLSQADSQAIFSSFKQGGILNSSNFVVTDPRTTTSWQSKIPSQYTAYTSDIGEQLSVAYAEHEFFSTLNNRTLNFLVNPTLVINLVPAVTSFTPTSGGVKTHVTLTGTNFLTANTTVQFNGTAVPDATISNSTTIRLQVPTGATTGYIKVCNTLSGGTQSCTTSQGKFTVK